jgi:hypothetical protein
MSKGDLPVFAEECFPPLSSSMGSQKLLSKQFHLSDRLELPEAISIFFIDMKLGLLYHGEYGVAILHARRQLHA